MTNPSPNDLSDASSVRVAFLGLGAMGERMARRLLDAGHPLAVYNRTEARAGALVEAGASLAKTPREAAQDADVIIAMVTDDDASSAMWLDEASGALGAAKNGALCIDSSTLTPGHTRKLAEVIGARGFAFVEAPVVGTRPQAEAGQLIYLLGGEASVVERARPVLERMGSAIHLCGAPGAGAVLKLMVNSLFGIQVAAVAELLAFARQQNVDAAHALEILGETPVLSPAAKGVGGLIVGGKFDPMFPIYLVEKDFSYAVETADAVGAKIPTSDAVLAVYREAVEAGHGGLNIAGVAKLYE